MELLGCLGGRGLAAEFLEIDFLSDDWGLLNQQTGLPHDKRQHYAAA